MNYPLYNNELCPRVWNKSESGYQLKPDVRSALLTIADDFIEKSVTDNDLSLTVKDVILLGSLSNFNWTPYSDFDLHVVVNFDELDMSPEDAKVLVDGLRSAWNKSHAITIKGHRVELYIQDIHEEPVAMSSYSVKNDEWIKPPVKQKPTFDKEFIKRKHSMIKGKLDDLFKEPSAEKLERMLERIYDMRQAGLDKKGEFSEENIVFKILRSQGYLDKLKELVNQVYDKEHSLDEIEKLDDGIWYDERSKDVFVMPDEPDGSDLIPIDGNRKRVHRFQGGHTIFGAYQTNEHLYRQEKKDAADWMPDEPEGKNTVGEYLIALRKAIKHPKQASAWKAVEELIDVSIDRLFQQTNVKEFTVLAPLGSTSKLNLIIAEKIKKRLGGRAIILNDFIAKNTWRNVKMSPAYYRVMAGAIATRGPNKGKMISKEGAMLAKKEYDKWIQKNPDAEFHVHDLAKASLRPFFSEFYKTKDGKKVDMIKYLKDSKVLIIDDTMESGATYVEALRVINEFQPAETMGYIFLYGRGTG